MTRSTSDVREYGATGDGSTRDTDAIQQALDDCSDSGGTVVVPPGEYLTAPLEVGDNTTLRLEAGATLQFVEDFSAFPTVQSRWEGWDQFGFHPCLWIADAENVEITGRGTIDGQGQYWWDFYEVPDADLPDGLVDRLDEFDERNDKADDVSSFTLRPPLLQIYESENVSISGVTLRNSPFWNTHVVYSKDVTIQDVTVANPVRAPNGDGIDIDSSECVKISDTYINAGDDAICLKSGKDAEGRKRGRSAEQITITNCAVEAGHGGVVIGSEMSGDVRDVTISNCSFQGTDRGIRIKTQRGRGGVVEDLRFDTIVMRDVVCPFVVNGYYFMDIDSAPVEVDETTPMVRSIHFSNITARNVESAGFLAGLPERYFEDIT
ncbi:MAG: glycoside hydrolase family 28 protein, partial [Halapricum sp.]